MIWFRSAVSILTVAMILFLLEKLGIHSTWKSLIIVILLKLSPIIILFLVIGYYQLKDLIKKKTHALEATKNDNNF